MVTKAVIPVFRLSLSHGILVANSMLNTRKKRVLIFDDESAILTILERRFVQRGYEVMTFEEPVICPLYENSSDTCKNIFPCADLMFVDFNMPGMNGIELLERQMQRGCKLNMQNKAIMTGYVIDNYMSRINDLGCALFRKPFTFSEISFWLSACEKRIDVSQRLGIKRKERRYTTDIQILYKSGKKGELLEGDIINLSTYGICIKIYRPLIVGEVITIQTKLPNPCQSAYVQWIKKIERNYFIAGLNCCQMDSSA